MKNENNLRIENTRSNIELTNRVTFFFLSGPLLTEKALRILSEQKLPERQLPKILLIPTIA